MKKEDSHITIKELAEHFEADHDDARLFADTIYKMLLRPANDNYRENV